MVQGARRSGGASVVTSLVLDRVNDPAKKRSFELTLKTLFLVTPHLRVIPNQSSTALKSATNCYRKPVDQCVPNRHKNLHRRTLGLLQRQLCFPLLFKRVTNFHSRIFRQRLHLTQDNPFFDSCK